MPAFGNPRQLTPNLDRLTGESLFFPRAFASGTRTVRGLEALALALPPTPGNAIVRRPHNEHLFSLASGFNAKGYASAFLYGGYGYFDNMNEFFSDNGYTVIDRLAVDRAISITRPSGALLTRALHRGAGDLRRLSCHREAVLRSPHDHLEPSTLHLSRRPNPHSFQDRA